MLGFLTSAGGPKAGPLTSASAVDGFWRSLPRSDPVAAQRAVADTLASVLAWDDPALEEVRALIALDQRSRSLADGLLVSYVPGSPRSPSVEKRLWQSAWDLARSFALAHEHVLGRVRGVAGQRAWREPITLVLLGMFYHRQIEALLRPIVAGPSLPSGWSGVHLAYKYAHQQGLLDAPVALRRAHATHNVETTLEREYVHLLLVDVLGGGQLSPYDTFWAHQSLPRWSDALTLDATPPSGEVDTRHGRFVVDLDSNEGLVRAVMALGTSLYVDPSPMLAVIESEIALVRDSIGPRQIALGFGRDRQLKVLRKLALMFSPTPPRLRRRGERRADEAPLRAVVGFSSIMRMLRAEEQKPVVVTEAAVPEVEEITITVFGGFTEHSQSAGHGPAGMGGAPGDLAVPYENWQLKDRSASGCRLQGACDNASRLLPGTLIAIREDGNEHWSLVVVRRMKRLPGGRAELGVEYVGQGPRRVKLTVPEASRLAAAAPPQPFAALYLAESPRQPVMPIKTLVLPAREYQRDRSLVLGSAGGQLTIRLKEPIEEQGDFVWLPYEIVARAASEDATDVARTAAA